VNSNPTLDDFGRQLLQSQDAFKLQLQIVQESYKTFANKFRNQAPNSLVEDKIWLFQ